MDRYDLYELCVQTPVDRVALLRAIHGGAPRDLAEDFGGTGAVARAWVTHDDATAVIIDRDPEPLARITPTETLRVLRADVRRLDDVEPDASCDVVYVGNFSIGELHTRTELVAYLRSVRRRLRTGGVLVCELYGGETAFLTGTIEREDPGPDGRVITYAWEQRATDITTGRVLDVIHFGVQHEGKVELLLNDAFVYDWRLWGVAELRDAMTEAGFEVEVYRDEADAVDDADNAYVEPVAGEDLDDSFVVLVTGRVT